MNILILAAERDVTADRMVHELTRRHVQALRLDTAWFPRRATIEAEFRRGRWTGLLRTGSRTVALEAVRAVWVRHSSTFDFDPQMSETERRWAMGEAKLGLGGVLAALPVRWVNHPSRNADASYKPRQLSTAAQCGLRTPDTLVTNAPDVVRRFAADAAAGSAIVAKALGAPSIVEDGHRKTAFTHRLDAAELADVRGVEQTVHQFQYWVPKADEARLIVVGRRVFAAAIHAGNASAFVDWRNDYTALRYEPIEPPPLVRDGVLAYCSAFGLNYGAFDFVIRPDQEWVFLECNPGGQFGWIEDAVAAPITAALADLLCADLRCADLSEGEPA